MKFRKLVNYTIISLLSIFIYSCGGEGDGSGIDLSDFNNSDFENGIINTSDGGFDPAPTTLDGTRLNVIGTAADDLSFFFTSSDFDTNTGIEQGTCHSFAVSTPSVTFTSNFGVDTVYELPHFVNTITYTYQKETPTSGQLIITGNGNGDGGSTLNDNNGIDIYVNQVPSGAEFKATLNLSFGSTGAITGSTGIDAVVLGTSDEARQTIDYRVDTATHGAQLTLQSGASLPLGYDASDASGVNRFTPAPFFPLSLSGIGEVILDFNTLSFPVGSTFNVDTYQIIGISSDNQGFANAIDQGIATVVATDLDGNITTYNNVPYGWIASADSTSRVRLILDIPNQFGGTTTETYDLRFNTNFSGDFIEQQPIPGIEGTVNVPSNNPSNN